MAKALFCLGLNGAKDSSRRAAIALITGESKPRRTPIVEPSGGYAMNASTKKPGESLSKDERDLSRMVALAGGLGLGATLALSEALRIKEATFSLQFSVKTLIAFALGFAVAFAYLSRILAHPERTSRFVVRGGLIIIIFLVLAAFIYPLRFSMHELAERLEGVVVALCFIAVGLTLIRSVVHAAEREEAAQEDKERAGSNNTAPRG